jgi:hypothetical protein
MEGSEDEENFDKMYNIKKVSQQVARKYGVEEYTIEASFNNDAVIQGMRLENIREEIHSMFDDVVHEIVVQYQEDDRIRLSIDHAGMDRPMTMHLQPRRNVTTENIMSRYVENIFHFFYSYT